MVESLPAVNTRRGLLAVALVVVLYVAVSFHGGYQGDLAFVKQDGGISNDVQLLPLLESIQKRLAQVETNEAAMMQTLALVQAKWHDDKTTQGQLERPGSASGAVVRSYSPPPCLSLKRAANSSF
jgi:hypothetical protein